MTLASTCKAVSGSVEERFCICLTKLGKLQTFAKEDLSIYTPHFLSAPLAQLTLAPMSSLPVRTSPTSMQTNNKANTTQIKGLIIIGKVFVGYVSGFHL